MITIALLALAAFLGWDRFKAYEAAHPEQFPWTALDLADPIGPFTDDKLASLGDEPQRCAALIAAAGLGDRPAAPRSLSTPQCGFDDGIELGAAPGARIPYGDITTACPVAAALALWERDVVQPAAERHLSTTVTRIDQLGSFSCRRLYGRDDGPWSEHATADAIDISGFRLADGRRLSLIADWQGDDAEARFLKEVRDGACSLFRTTLSPDYNAAHADHFHLDMASGRPAGWSICR